MASPYSCGWSLLIKKGHVHIKSDYWKLSRIKVKFARLNHLGFLLNFFTKCICLKTVFDIGRRICMYLQIHCYEVNFMQYRAVFIRIKILFQRHFSNNMSLFFSIQHVWKTNNNPAFNDRYLMIAHFFNNSYLKENMISDLSWWYFILYCTGYIVQAKNSFYIAEY